MINLIDEISNTESRIFCIINGGPGISRKTIKYSNGIVLNIGTGSPVKIIDIINKVRKKIGKGEPILGKIKLRKNENLRLYANNSRIKKLMKWQPKVKLNEGLVRTINYYRKKYE